MKLVIKYVCYLACGAIAALAYSRGWEWWWYPLVALAVSQAVSETWQKDGPRRGLGQLLLITTVMVFAYFFGLWGIILGFGAWAAGVILVSIVRGYRRAAREAS